MLALGEWLPTSTGLSGICPVWLSKPNQIHNALSVVALINAFHCLINIDKCTLAREKFLNRDAVVVQVTGLMITVRPLALHQKWPRHVYSPLSGSGSPITHGSPILPEKWISAGVKKCTWSSQNSVQQQQVCVKSLSCSFFAIKTSQIKQKRFEVEALHNALCY